MANVPDEKSLEAQLLNRELERRIVELERETAERKRAEEAVLASRVRLRAILNTAVDAIIVIDAEGIIRGIQIGEVVDADFERQYAKIAP